MGGRDDGDANQVLKLMSQRITLESLTKYSVISNCQTEECQKQEGQLVDCHTYVKKRKILKFQNWLKPETLLEGEELAATVRTEQSTVLHMKLILGNVECKTKALIYKLCKVKVTFLCP